MDGNDYLFNIPADERKRANRAKLEPARLETMRCLASLGSDHAAADSRRCHREPGLFGQRHAAALGAVPGKDGVSIGGIWQI